MNIKQDYEHPPIVPGWDYSDSEIRTSLDEDRPLQISLWLSNRCNLQCTYCFRDAGDPLPNELSLEEYIELINQARDMGVGYIFISGSGEPTFDEKFVPISRHIKNSGLRLVLVSNLTLITPKLAEELSESNAVVIGKMNSLIPEVQNKLAGNIPWAYDRIQKGLNLLIKVGLNASKPTRLGIETPILPSNYKEIPSIYRYARDRNILPVVEMLSNTGRGRKIEEVSVGDTKALFQELLKIDKKYYGYSWVPTPPYAAFQCRRFLYNLVIDSQGWVLPCFGVEEQIVNIRELTLQAIWGLPMLRKNRKIYEFLQGACRTCMVSQKTGCYGCRGRSHVITGNMFNEDISCWYTKTHKCQTCLKL